MKHVQLFAGAALALTLASCGGSGGGSASPAKAAFNSVPRVEAYVLNPTTYDTGVDANGLPFSYLIQDPLNIESQDVVQFQLVNYTTSGTTTTRNVIATTNWSSTDQSGQYGTLAYASGLFTAGTGQTLTNETATTFENGQPYSTAYAVKPRQVRLRGQVLAYDSINSPTKPIPLGGVEVDFYGPQNPSDPTSPTVFVGRVTTAYNGTFRASIPATTTSFQLLNNTLPTGYFRYYEFQGNYYSTGDLSCTAPLPQFTNGERYLIDYSNADLTQNGTILVYGPSDASILPTAASLSCSG